MSSTKLSIRHDSKIGKDIASKLGEIKNEGVTKLGLETLQTEIKTEDDALKPQTQSLSKEALDANPTLKSRVDKLNKKKGEYMQKATTSTSSSRQETRPCPHSLRRSDRPWTTSASKSGADVVLSSSSTWYIKDTDRLSKKVIERLDATTTLAGLPQGRGPRGRCGRRGGCKARQALMFKWSGGD